MPRLARLRAEGRLGCSVLSMFVIAGQSSAWQGRRESPALERRVPWAERSTRRRKKAGHEALRLARRAAGARHARVECLEGEGTSGARRVAVLPAVRIANARGVALLECNARGVRAARERLRATARVDAGLANGVRRGAAALATRGHRPNDDARPAVTCLGAAAGGHAIHAPTRDARRREPALRAGAAITAGRRAIVGHRAGVAGSARAGEPRRRGRAQSLERLVRRVVAAARAHRAGGERSASARNLAIAPVPGLAGVQSAAAPEERSCASGDDPSQRLHGTTRRLSRRRARCRASRNEGLGEWPRPRATRTT